MERVRKAQSIVEYTLLLGAIIAAVVFVLMKQGGMASTVGNTYDRVTNSVDETTGSATFGVFGFANDAGNGG